MKNVKIWGPVGLLVVIGLALVTVQPGGLSGVLSSDAQDAGALAAVTVDESLPEVTVYKNASCGCCSKWADHLRAAGFKVETEDVLDLVAVKRETGVLPELGSCHTAIIDGYVVEGHVPAEDIKRLLAERPDIKGLAVPGMPMGSPGMEGARKDPYMTLSFDAEGKTEVWAAH